MILSMTGFGRGTAVRNGREITVELRSVNSRYFESVSYTHLTLPTNSRV